LGLSCLPLETQVPMSKSTKSNLSGQPILSQLFHFIPESIIKESVEKHKSDHYTKKFRTKDHLLCMMFGVLTKCSTLREICKNILFMGTKLSYCGLVDPPKRSTFSDANAERSHEVFGAIYYKLYAHYRSFLSDSHMAMHINREVDPEKVEVFDSTTITLFKEVLKGAGRNPVDGKRKGAIKAHTQARLSDMVPHFIHFTAGASNDRDFLKVMELPQGSIGVFDKGFHNYASYQQWNESNRFYVTRLNDNARFKVIEQLPVEHSHEDGVISDQLIELSYACKTEKIIKKVKARLICYIDPVSGKKLAFLTNMFDAKAWTVCLLYQNRWTIEVLFKQLKQNFELSYFLSDSENGIKIQIWVALILNLLFEVIHRQIKEAEDFATMVKIAAKNLCSYVSLVKFLMNPFAEWLKEKEKELSKMQLNLFHAEEGGVFENSA
jgi:hypothetical protein